MIKCRTCVIGIFPNEATTTRFVGFVLLEQDEHLAGGAANNLTRPHGTLPPAAHELPSVKIYAAANVYTKMLVPTPI